MVEGWIQERGMSKEKKKRKKRKTSGIALTFYTPVPPRRNCAQARARSFVTAIRGGWLTLCSKCDDFVSQYALGFFRRSGFPVPGLQMVHRGNFGPSAVCLSFAESSLFLSSYPSTPHSPRHHHVRSCPTTGTPPPRWFPRNSLQALCAQDWPLRSCPLLRHYPHVHPRSHQSWPEQPGAQVTETDKRLPLWLIQSFSRNETIQSPLRMSPGRA